MKKLINVFIIIFVSLLTFNCSSINKMAKSDVEIYGDTMKYAFYMKNASLYQLDSIIIADTLPSLDLWFSTSFIDFETNAQILKRMCIKSYETNNEVIYVVLGKNEPFQIEKRIRK